MDVGAAEPPGEAAPTEGVTMTDKLTIEQIEALIDTEGYAAAIAAVLDGDVPKVLAVADILAVERYEDNGELHCVLYVFRDESSLTVWDGTEIEIG